MPPSRRAHARLSLLDAARLAGLRTGTRAGSSLTTRHSHRSTATEAKRPTLRTAHRPTRAPTRRPRSHPSGAPIAGRAPCASLAALDQNGRRAESVNVASSREKQAAGCAGGPAATSRRACHGQSGSHDRAGPTLAFVTPTLPAASSAAASLPSAAPEKPSGILPSPPPLPSESRSGPPAPSAERLASAWRQACSGSRQGLFWRPCDHARRARSPWRLRATAAVAEAVAVTVAAAEAPASAAVTTTDSRRVPVALAATVTRIPHQSLVG